MAIHAIGMQAQAAGVQPYSEELEKSWKDLGKNPNVLTDADGEIIKLVRAGNLYNAPSPYQGRLGPLEYAVKYTNSVETIRALVDARVTPVLFLNADENDALNRALADGAPTEVVTLLLGAGAVPTQPSQDDQRRRGTLDRALEGGAGQELLNALANAGAKGSLRTVESARKQGRVLPEAALPAPLPEEPKKPVIRIEAPRPAPQPANNNDVNPEKWNNQLYYAARGKNLERRLREALNHKALPRPPGPGESGTLHSALENGYSDEVIGLLIEAGGKPNNDERTLHIAINKGYSEQIVSRLLDSGAIPGNQYVLAIAKSKNYSQPLLDRLSRSVPKVSSQEEAIAQEAYLRGLREQANPPVNPQPRPPAEPVVPTGEGSQNQGFLGAVVSFLGSAWQWVRGLFASIADFFLADDED